VDGYAPVVAGLERDIDQIEATVFSGAVAPTERIYSLRREATDFYRAVHPLLAVVTTIERATEAPQLQPYLRDVHDHLLLVNEEVAAQRDLLGTVLEANMAVISVEQTKVSVRQNTTIEQLTILATVFLPLTFITGFFGQNFSWLVGHIAGPAAFVIYGIGGLVVPLVLLFWWLRLRTLHTNTAAALHDNGPEREAKPTATMRATASIDACYRHRIVTAPEVTPTPDVRSRYWGTRCPPAGRGPASDRDRGLPPLTGNGQAPRARTQKWPKWMAADIPELDLVAAPIGGSRTFACAHMVMRMCCLRFKPSAVSA
jgi:hypothetical protein